MNKPWILIPLLLASPLALAGEGADHVGNGGAAIVCRDAAGAVQKAWSLDLWTAETLPREDNGGQPLTIDRDDGNSEKGQILNALHRISEVNFRAYRMVKTAWEYLKKHTTILPVKFARIPDSSDFASPEVAGLDCKREQVAVYTKEHGLVIVEAIWNKFHETDRAALKMHEAVYMAERGHPIYAKTSDHTQVVVPRLFSREPLRMETLGELARICKNVKVETRTTAGTIFDFAVVDPVNGKRVKAHAGDIPTTDYSFHLCGRPNSEVRLDLYLYSGSDLDTRITALERETRRPLGEKQYRHDGSWASSTVTMIPFYFSLGAVP